MTCLVLSNRWNQVYPLRIPKKFSVFSDINDDEDSQTWESFWTMKLTSLDPEVT